MNEYFLDRRQGTFPEEDKKKTVRLYVVVDVSFYWAIEWEPGQNEASHTIVDMHAGFLSAELSEACAQLEKVTPDVLREKYGTFADYIERSVSGFRSYMLWIHPDPDTGNVQWTLHRRH